MKSTRDFLLGELGKAEAKKFSINSRIKALLGELEKVECKKIAVNNSRIVLLKENLKWR